MKKSTVTRLIKIDGLPQYIQESARSEVYKDDKGNTFTIHYHKASDIEQYYNWCATEDSTGLKCTVKNFHTLKECSEWVKNTLIPNLSEVLKRNKHYQEKMKEYRGKLNEQR